VGQEMGHRGQQERAELPQARIHRLEITFLQEPGEESLRQVTRVLMTVPLASDEDVKGIPVGPAQSVHGGSGLWRTTVASSDNDGPMRRCEYRGRAPGRVVGSFGRIHTPYNVPNYLEYEDILSSK